MALSATLIDRARVLRVQRGSQRVDGGSTALAEAGAWFACRFEPAGAPVSAQGGPPRVEASPSLIYEPPADPGLPRRRLIGWRSTRGRSGRRRGGWSASLRGC